MAFTPRNTATYYDSSSSSSGVINKVTNVANNDVMFAMISHTTGHPTTVPSGWTRIYAFQSTYFFSVFMKVASSEGSSYTWGFPSAGKCRIVNTAFYGDFDINDVILTCAEGSYSSTGYRFFGGSVYAQYADTPVIHMCSAFTTTLRTFTPPTDFTEADDSGNTASDFSGSVSYRLAPQGAVLNPYASASGSTSYQSGLTISLRPSGKAATDSIVSHSSLGVGRTGSGTNLFVYRTPQYVRENDLMFVILGGTDIASAITVTPPSGWTLLTTGGGALNNGSRVYYKLASASDSYVDYTFTFDQTLRIYYSSFIVRNRDIKTSNPFYSYSNGAYSTANNSIYCFSILAGTNCSLLAIGSWYDQSYSHTGITISSGPGTFVEFLDGDNGNDNHFGNILNGFAGGITGDVVATIGASANFTVKQGYLIAIQTNSTLAPTPLVTTQEISSIESSRVTGNGNILSTRGINPHLRGFAYKSGVFPVKVPAVNTTNLVKNPDGPTQDTTNYPNQVWSNIYSDYGTNNYTRKVVMQFNVSAYTAAQLANVKLRIYCTYNDAVGSLYVNKLKRTDWAYNQATSQIYKTGSSWGTVMASNTTSDIEVTSPATVERVNTNTDGGSWIEFNVSAIAIDAKNNNSGIVNLIVWHSPSAATGVTTIYDNGNTDATVRPYLQVGSEISLLDAINPSFEDATLGWAGVGTIVRSSEQAKYGSYSMKITWTSGSEAYAEIHPTPATYQSKKVTFGCWVWSNVANMACLNIYDNAGAGYETNQSAFHTGDGTWQFLTISRTLRGSLTDLIFRCRIATGSANSAYFDGVIIAYNDDDAPLITFDNGNYGTGAYTKLIEGLTPLSNYKVCAFAQNSAGVGFGYTVEGITLSLPAQAGFLFSMIH